MMGYIQPPIYEGRLMFLYESSQFPFGRGSGVHGLGFGWMTDQPVDEVPARGARLYSSYRAFVSFLHR